MTFYIYMKQYLNTMGNFNELAWVMHFDVLLFPTLDLENVSASVWKKRILDKPYLQKNIVDSLDEAIEKFKEIKNEGA